MPFWASVWWVAYLILSYRTDPYTRGPLLMFFVAAMLSYGMHVFAFLDMRGVVTDTIYYVANLCVFPFMGLYIRHLTHEKKRAWCWLLWAPAVIMLFATLICELEGLTDAMLAFVIFARASFLCQVVFVVIYGRKMLLGLIGRADDFYSDERGETLKLLRVMLLVVSLAGIVSVLIVTLGWTFGIRRVFITLLMVLMGVIWWIFGYQTTRLPIFARVPPADEMSKKQVVKREHTTEKDFGAPTLAEQTEFKLRQALEEYLVKDEPWRTPDLTIVDVAKALGTNRSYISKIFNTYYHTNFAQAISRLRVEEAKKVLMTSSETGVALVEEIIERCGFPSEASFYRVFREQVGETPMAYKRRLKKE